jgi:hypothetical protein
MKQIFDLFTRAEIEIIVNTGKLSEEQKALFKREGIAQKEAINYAKEVLKYLPSDEASETEEEFDEDTFFAPEEEQAEPTANFEEVAQEQPEEETQPEELLQEIEKVVSEQPAQTAQEPQKRTGRTALERMMLLDRLEELKEKHDKTVQMLTRIAGMTKEHNENEGVSLRIETPKFPNITISKSLAVGLCLKFVFEETDKQRQAIENEIENLDF